MRHLIGITGHMGSGKSAAAAYIVEKYGFIRMRISGKMREISQELELEITRDLLQGVGKFFREFDDDVWIRYLAKKIQTSTDSIVVDDIRRINEVEYLKPLGFKFIKIESSSETRKMRLETRMQEKISDQDWKRWSNHLTEIQVIQLPVDYTITNNGTLKELEDAIDNVLLNHILKN
ncbi:MAG: AAA family ATPase [Candidatus Heimdallarchaeota archaeon]|nr:MAG: AAA family ATPase [Candidatus Heimdallarchaeota archaeon]